MLSTFSSTCWPFIYVLWENVYSVPLPIFNWVVYFFAIELYEFFMYVGFIPYQIRVVCNFFPFHSLSFHFVDCFLCCTETIYFDVVPLVYFLFCCLCFRCHILKVAFLMFVIASVVSFRTLYYILQQYSTEL